MVDVVFCATDCFVITQEISSRESVVAQHTTVTGNDDFSRTYLARDSVLCNLIPECLFLLLPHLLDNLRSVLLEGLLGQRIYDSKRSRTTGFHTVCSDDGRHRRYCRHRWRNIARPRQSYLLPWRQRVVGDLILFEDSVRLD